MNKALFCFTVILMLAACKSSVKPEAVIGKWKYIKVEKPYSPNPPDTLSAKELSEKAPSVQFSANGELVMMWEGKMLSHGQYKVDSNYVRYKEIMPDGKTRQFPFYVSKLTDTEIIFETKEDNPVRVTAIKVK